jgi:uncharacterized protein YndB with AHSA1/START domain
MKYLLFGGGLVAFLIAAVLVVAAAQPDMFQVQRSASIKAPPERIFSLINEFQKWPAWSPYEKKDPDMTRSYAGPPAGKGAVYAWEGDKNVGAGRMEITDAAAPGRVTIALDFSRPFEAHNIVNFTMEPKGETTEVTWAMQGRQPLFAKVICLFINMDRMVGTDFETGLANLKTAAEART